MIEIFPISTAPKDGTVIRGVFLTNEKNNQGVQKDVYWCQRYSDKMNSWAWRGSTFCTNAPDGWMPIKTSVFS
jgi:hypothetical protein